MPNTEPIFVKQASDVHGPDRRLDWFAARVREAYAAQCTFFRFSQHPNNPSLILIEGWPDRPDEQGEPRFAIARLGG